MMQSDHTVELLDVVEIQLDEKEECYGQFLWSLRLAIADTMEVMGLTAAQLARTLKVSRSVVSKLMNPDVDIKASTLFEVAWALKKRWHCTLVDRKHHASEFKIKHTSPGFWTDVTVLSLDSSIDPQKLWEEAEQAQFRYVS